ncbi:MAG: N-carbamoylputrescine amidase [Gemmatimonadetes bacterium]|nr:N-carbamoylputrescine amidase [Gemmatimonadota bacterium]
MREGDRRNREDDVDMSRRAFVTTTVAGAIAFDSSVARASTVRVAGTRPHSQAFALDEATIDDLQSRMRAGGETSRSLTQQYLARIDAIDQRGPAINAVIELNPDALAIADQLDAERKSGKVRGPMHGIPVLIKDNIDTADRMHTTAGSLALADNIAPRDSFVAERLRAAGAVILGKTNLSEWANFRSTHSSSGWSGRGGQTRNPYALDRTPSGSSSGSGSATGANCCVVAIGTETDGSVTSPAAAAALVGIKPTLGLISRSGIIPIAHSQDTAGPMARTVKDAAILLGVLTGVDARDGETRHSTGHALTDYTASLDKNGLRGARIGVARKRYTGYSVATDKLLDAALDLMKQQGATIVDPADIATAGQVDNSEFELLLYEFKADLNAYLSQLGPHVAVRSLADVIAFNSRNASRELRYFGQEIMELAQKKGPLTEKKYLADLARNRRLMREKGIDATMAKYKLDALVAPTQGPAALIDLVNGDPGGGGSFTGPAAVAGYPHVTVPMGFSRGLPVGISFVGRAWSEPTLLKLAYAFEHAAPARRAPTFAATVDVGDTRRGM